MALTADQLNTIYNNVLFRNVDFSGIQFFANRTDISDAQVRQQIELSNEATTLVAPIVRLYQEVLGRVPDTAGLKFFVNEFRTGFTSEQIAQQLISSTEFQAKTTATAGAVDATDLTNTNQLVTDAFQSILGRAPSTGEFTYFQGRPAAQILSQIAVSPEAQQLNASAVVTYLDSAATGQTNTGTLNNQTSPTGTSSGGQSFTFAAGNTFETLTGTAGNDTFRGLAANVDATDTVSGGAGFDTVEILNAAAPPVVPQLTGVEALVFTTPTTGTTVDLSAISGLTNVNLKNVTGAYATAGTGITVAAGVAAGFDNVVTTGAVTFTEASASTKTVQAYLANGSNVAALNLNGAGLTTLNLDSAGTKANTVGALASTGTETTVNLTGAGKLVITDALDASVTTVNASGNTGGVTVALGASATTVTGGSGNDKFAFAGNLTAADTVVGGAGTDTISITGSDLTTANNVQLSALNTKVTGVEVLEFTGAGATTIAGGTTATSFTNSEITKLLFNTTDNDTVNAAGSARTYAVGEINTGDLTLNLGTGVTTVNVSLEGISSNGATAANGGDIGVLTVNNNAGAAAGAVNTVNIASLVTSLDANGTTVANTVATLTDVLGSTYKISGGADLTVTALTNAGTIDGTSFTGKFGLTTGAAGNTVISLGTGGTATTGVNTGVGLDTVSAQGGTNVINTGAGNDTITVTAGTNTITGGAGADSITLGSGSDKVVYTTLSDSTAATPATTLDTLTNFAAGTDKFIVTTTPTTVFQGSTFTAAGTGTLATDIGAALTAGGQGAIAANQAAVVTITGTGAGTYLVINDATPNYQNANDAVIKLIGLTGTLATTDFATA
ncbi:DUF4214 domain-containing protein [Methylobacterium sp. WL103]|uniref:DUF4214 domain-containing protein n=1 Tax=Methylobacterium sp. WL103 TaxID=2603891 RepID=UPI001650604F|nr:DUF4214 domain-containing protein [Methylobacterium sp. WL103]